MGHARDRPAPFHRNNSPARPGFPLPVTGESTYDYRKHYTRGHRLAADARGPSQAFPKNHLHTAV